MSRTNHREREANRTRGVYDKSCRNHGSCQYCAEGRMHTHLKRGLVETDFDYIIPDSEDIYDLEDNEDWT
jgi:hypothetical protein